MSVFPNNNRNYQSYREEYNKNPILISNNINLSKSYKISSKNIGNIFLSERKESIKIKNNYDFVHNTHKKTKKVAIIEKLLVINVEYWRQYNY